MRVSPRGLHRSGYTVTRIGGTADATGAACRDAGTAGRGGGKAPEGGWRQEARSGPGGVPCDRPNFFPITPSPAGAAAAVLPACPSLQPPRHHGCHGHPWHSRGARGARTTNPPYRPAPLLQARSRHKPRCFLSLSCAVHYATSPTPKDLSFLFSPVPA